MPRMQGHREGRRQTMTADNGHLPLQWSKLGSSLAPSLVSVLFARRDSIYKTLPGCDVWDIDRDALSFDGVGPIVAHPPCRAWGRLAHMANPRPGERDLAPWAVAQIRAKGGVLEHPAASKLWPTCSLPDPGELDGWGGFTVQVQQFWWGHRAEKWTRLYICGCEPSDIPPIPHRDGRPPRVISTSHGLRRGHPNFRTRCTDREREATPPMLAEWLVAAARRCKSNNAAP